MKKFMFVNRRPPYGTIYALESLEVVLITATFDQDVSLVFVDDGVYELAKGHEVMRVFFYHDGVNNATRLTEPPQDDRHVVNRWSALHAEHGVDLVVCVAAALRRGIKDEVLAPGFRISGLGQLVDAGIKADRTVTFGD